MSRYLLQNNGHVYIYTETLAKKADLREITPAQFESYQKAERVEKDRFVKNVFGAIVEMAVKDKPEAILEEAVANDEIILTEKITDPEPAPNPDEDTDDSFGDGTEPTKKELLIREVQVMRSRDQVEKFMLETFQVEIDRELPFADLKEEAKEAVEKMEG